ncbi:MAG: hypothetical protein WBW69_07150, partial [Candidatus Korobacteraceae bacterium]
MPKEEFRREVEKDADGKGRGALGVDLLQGVRESDSGHWRAIETAALMLGSDKSRGYCLEMICADFLAGAHLDGGGNPEILLQSLSRYY